MENTQGKAHTADLVNGPIAPTLFAFSFPFMLSTLLQTAYSTTDTIVVGQFLGSAGLAAVSNGSQLMQMLYSICIGFSNAGQVLIAQARGANNYRKLEKIIGTLLVMEVILAVVIGGVSMAVSEFLLRTLQTPPEAFVQARLYLLICSAGMLFTGLYNMFSAVLRGMGDSRHPLLFVFIATVMNVILDIVFIAAFGWNVAGAAFATVIGQAASVLFSLRFFLKNSASYGIRIRKELFVPDRETAVQLISIGTPFAVQMATIQLSFLFVGRMINRLGVTVSAVFGVMQKIRSMPMFICQGFGLGASSMMGQNLGARRLDRVEKTVRYCILFCAAVYTCFAVLYLGFPDLCFRLFTQDETIASYAGMAMRILALELPALTFMPACNGLVNAQGFVKLSFVVMLLDAFLGRILFCWLLGSFFGMGAQGYFLGYVLGTYVTSVIVTTYFFSGLWKKRQALVD